MDFFSWLEESETKGNFAGSFVFSGKSDPVSVVCAGARPGFPSSSNFNFEPLRGGEVTNYRRINMIL